MHHPELSGRGRTQARRRLPLPLVVTGLDRSDVPPHEIPRAPLLIASSRSTEAIIREQAEPQGLSPHRSDSKQARVLYLDGKKLAFACPLPGILGQLVTCQAQGSIFFTVLTRNLQPLLSGSHPLIE